MVFVLGFKKRFIVPISLGLGIAYAIDDVVDIDQGPKRQTIRARGKRRRPREGETLRLFTAMRTKYCRKIADVRCARVRWITIWFSQWQYPPHQPTITVQIEGAGSVLGPRQLKAFARADGFRNARDMAEFWLKEHKNKDGKFTGDLIEWEPITDEASQPEGALQCSPNPNPKKLVAA